MPRTVSQVSRVAVIGANGAGKSTAIKVLVGEQLPTEGTIWKAQGLRMAYVAQHAFHHLEKHMQETPTQYIMWRFAGNDDRESIEFKTEDLSVDEEKARAQKWCIDSVTGNVRRCTDPKEDAKPLGSSMRQHIRIIREPRLIQYHATPNLSIPQHTSFLRSAVVARAPAPRKAKQDEAGAVVPDAIVNRRQKKKEKTFEYEAAHAAQVYHQSAGPQPEYIRILQWSAMPGEVAVQVHGQQHLGGEGHPGEDGLHQACAARG